MRSRWRRVTAIDEAHSYLMCGHFSYHSCKTDKSAGGDPERQCREVENLKHGLTS